jgi:polysaccharide export outer membrane protein
MSQLPLSLLKGLSILVILAACSLPRGAALQTEILSKSKTETPDIAVYSITKSFLPIVADWPVTGLRGSGRWLQHKHGPSTPIIASGDAVKLVIWDSEENSLLTSPEEKVIEIDNVIVSPNGTIFVPYLKQIKISGLSDEAARSKIQTQLEGIIPSAQVQLTTKRGLKSSVSLVGGVGAPGSYPIIDPHYTVLNLISQGGGASPALRNPHVRLIRAGRTYKSSLDRIYKNPALDTVIKGGDKVILEDDERYFRSLGAASKEQIINFGSDDSSALDAMSLVGGISNFRANPKGILVLREYHQNAVRSDGSGPGNTRSVFVIDLTSSDGLFSAGRFAINSNDTVLVTESPLTAVNTVFGIIGSVFGIAIRANDIN